MASLRFATMETMSFAANSKSPFGMKRDQESEDKTDDPYNKVRIRFVFVIDHSGQKRKQHKNTFEFQNLSKNIAYC